MIFAVILVVGLLSAAAALSGNDFLAEHSYVFYGLELIIFTPLLLRRSRLLAHLFLPSTFALAYWLLSLTFGSYLVPRGFGWNKEYTDVVLSVYTYPTIVPYLLLANGAAFLLSWRATRHLRSRALATSDTEASAGRVLGWPVELSCVVVFMTIGVIHPYGAFAYMLAIAVVHLSALATAARRRRFAAYAVYVIGVAAFQFENKRELVMMLALVGLLESYHRQIPLRITKRTLFSVSLAVSAFFALVLGASVRRGYGGYETRSIWEALGKIPEYTKSDLFVDGLTDNLELNYSYGAAVTSISLVDEGRMPYQRGSSFLKVLFLPVPRTLFPDKPESVIQVYTKTFAPSAWAAGGSLPVMFPSEMYLNFWYLGLLALVMVFWLLNSFYRRLAALRPGSFGHLSALFLTVTVLSLARGSGLDGYALYYLLAAPFLALGSFATRIAGRRRTAIASTIRR